MTYLVDNRSGVVQTYKGLGGTEVDDLPPFYCGVIARGAAAPAPAGMAEAFIGAMHGELLRVGDADLHVLAAGDVSAVLAAVGLSGYGLARPSSGHLRLLKRALSELEAFAPDVLGVIQAFLSLVVFVEPGVAAGPVFSSTSFYEFPHCAFFTDAVFAHIAPEWVFSKVTLYAVQENIFHEALHQKLIVSWLTRPALRTGMTSRADLRVWVPWRKTRWSLEHSLQAAYVYDQVSWLRERGAARPGIPDLEANLLRQAARQARAATAHLRQEILRNSDVLTPDGRSLAEGLSA